MHSSKRGIILGVVMSLATLAFGSAAECQRPTPRRGTSSPARRTTPNEPTKGVMLGVHTIAAPGISIYSAEFDPGYGTSFGMGAGFMLGYGFNNRISSFLSFDVAKQGSTKAVEGSFGLGHLEAGIRGYFPNISLGWPRTVPYLIGSVGRRALAARVIDHENDESGEVAFDGMMLGLGAGIEHFISPTMSFDAGLHLGFGTFDRFTVDREIVDYGASSTTTMRLRVGVTWRP